MRRWLGLWLIGYDWRNLIAENEMLWERNEQLVKRLAKHELPPPRDPGKRTT